MTEDILFRVQIETAGGEMTMAEAGRYCVRCPEFLSYKIIPLVKAFRAKGYNVQLDIMYR